MTKARTLADFISDGNPLADGTIAVSEVSGAAPLASPSFTGNIAVTGNVDGRDVAADGTKLDGIETSATADQTDAEIRTAVEAATDSNVFTDADHSKLNAIEASATADQSNAEIRTAVEAATDSNVFTDADHSKLNAIEASATADQTKADIDALNINADLLDGQHGAYYTGYTDTAVAGIVDSSPAALNTLNELAAALGDDANFATTTANSIGTKMPLAGGTFTGAVNFTVDSNFTDGDKLTFGSSNDLQLYHDGSNSYVSDQGTGDLVIQGGANIIFEKTGGEDMLTMANDGSVVIKYNGVDRIETTTSGIDVTGTVNADALTGIGSIDATTKNAIVAAGVGSSSLMAASGGSVTTSGDYKIHTFTSSGTFTVTSVGFVQFLAVGGGGGGGGNTSGVSGAGGGGAGGLNEGYLEVSRTGAISVIVGTGGVGTTGASASTSSHNGGTSGIKFPAGSVVSFGGGKGGAPSNVANDSGVGSGGGGAPSYAGSTAFPLQGNDGGSSVGGSYGGGGGGAGTVGGLPNGGTTAGGNGGNGIAVSISGSSVTYAGGGGGGGWAATSSGGSGGGGNGGKNGIHGTNATGIGSGGGGGGGNGYLGGSGSNGIVIIKYKFQ